MSGDWSAPLGNQTYTLAKFKFGEYKFYNKEETIFFPLLVLKRYVVHPF